MTPFNPDSWMDAFVLLALGFSTVLAAAAPAWITQRKRDKTIGEIKEQVCNNHESNMRDDIDRLAEIMTEGFADLRSDVSQLRQELHTERLERIEGDRLRVIRAMGG